MRSTGSGVGSPLDYASRLQGRLECDVLIVGARVAGATLATMLGAGGMKVILIDTASFPSATLSTHFFRGEWGVAALVRLGVLDEVLALGPPKLVCQYDYVEGVVEPQVSDAQSPGALGFCLSVRRERLDDILVRRAAREAAVTVLERTRFVETISDRKRVVGARISRNGELLDVTCRFLVGADGRRSAVAKAVDAVAEVSDPPMRALYYQYVRDFPSPGDAGPEFSLRGDEIAYVFPSDDSLACVAVSVNMERFRALRSSLATEFRNVIDGHPGLAGRFAHAEPASRVLGCGPETSYVRRPVGAGWALVGDASIHQDPWSGRGIDFATTHATFLAEALLDAAAGGNAEREAMHRYNELRDGHGLAGYRETTEFAADIGRLSEG
jgi:menaquinone-9 beta-reductase